MGDEIRRPSLLRRWLGDSSHSRIEVLRGIPTSQVEKIAELFPEATVFVDEFRWR